ncbi:MAG: FAD-dependent monooxygenase [Pseudomonadota bacterium]
MTPASIPVLIIGSGAAGSMLALELARFGIEFRCVDRLPEASRYSRAVTVHARTLEMLERIDASLIDRFVSRGVHSPGYVMHFVDGSGKRSEVRPGLDFTQLPSRYPILLLHSQDETEGHLRNYLQEAYGRSAEWGVTCTHVTQQDEGVLATLQHADGREEQVHCQYLIAADGGGSRIRQQLNWEKDGSDYASTVLQNLDVFLHDFPDQQEWVHYCMGPAHFVMVVRLPGGYFRLLMSQPADKAAPDAVPQQVFSDILAQHFDGIRMGDTVWHSRWGSRIHLAKTYRQGNVFLAGDAAHVHSTAGGQGMNCCMQDAYNLGWKLAYVLKGWAPPALLDSYDSERKPIGSQVIAAASAIHELFMAGRNNDPAALLALKESGKLQALVTQVSGISYHYRHAETADKAGLQAGDRMPDVALPQGSLFALSRHDSFILLVAATAQPSADLSAQLDTLLRHHHHCVKVLLLPQAPAWLTGNGDQLYLIRPDGYVAVRCAANELQHLQAWLAGDLLALDD